MQLWVFIFLKYGKIWSISPGHFIKHKLLISEELSMYFFPYQILRKRLLMKIFDCQSLKRIQRFQNMRWDDNRLKIFHFLYVIIMGQACVENKDRSWYRMRWVSKVEPIFVKALKACSIYDKTKCKQRRFVNKILIEAQWAETRKKSIIF